MAAHAPAAMWLFAPAGGAGTHRAVVAALKAPDPALRDAGVVSLVPEVRRMLADDFAGRAVGLLAAGGIVDAKGVAAMMALGESTQRLRSSY